MTNNFTTITIDGIDISRYSEYYVINHITKKEEPKRSNNFAMANINDINQIEIPEIFVTFKFIPIDLYRQLFKATRKAEFKVVYYDQDYDKIRTNMFYYKESSSYSPHSWGASRYVDKNKAFLGFKDYKLDLVCTMNPINDLDIQLVYNNDNVPKPFYINLNKSSNASIMFKITNLNQDSIAGDINVTFSNNDLSISNAVSSSAGRYVITCSTNGTSYTLDLSKLKRTGESVMFLSINDLQYNGESFGSTTISVILNIN